MLIKKWHFQNQTLGLIRGYLDRDSKNSVNIKSEQKNLDFYQL